MKKINKIKESTNKNTVCIDTIDFAGETGRARSVFACECGFQEVEREFIYCPMCGSKIEWGF